jgi:hypothetical protein
MMWLIVTVVAAVAMTLLLDRYLRRSAKSFMRGEEIWSELQTNAAQIVENERYPLGVACLAHALSEAAGCGCFVRAMLMGHYTPKLLFWRRQRAAAKLQHTPWVDDLSQLSEAQKKQLNTLFIKVIIFDSYANPLQGWLLRRLVRNHFAPEAKKAVLSVVARKLVATADIMAAGGLRPAT